jgi:hypothetical protein
MMIVYNDNSQMPHGYHQGKLLKDVPPGYLLLIYESMYNSRPSSDYPLSEYIHSNLSRLKSQNEQHKTKNS